MKELQVSLFQTLCLLLFNDGNEFTLEDIATATAIGRKKMYRLVTSCLLPWMDGLTGSFTSFSVVFQSCQCDKRVI